MTFEIISVVIFALIVAFVAILIAYHLFEDNNHLTNELNAAKRERVMQLNDLSDRIEQLKSVERILQSRLDYSEKNLNFALDQNSLLNEEITLLKKKLEIVYSTISSLQEIKKENTDPNSANQGDLS